MWQDWVISIGNIIIGLSLINTVRDSQKPPLSTSIPSAICLVVFGITNFTLELYVSTAVLLLIAFIWIVIAVQRIKQPKELEVKK